MRINTPAFNEDGVSLKGCKYIYAPRGQAGEYAPLATNPFRGCGHGCAYCYVPKVIHMDRKDFDAGAVLRDGFLEGVTRDAARYKAAGVTEQVMISFTSDPYNPDDVDTAYTRQVWNILIANGLGICALSKGGRRAFRDADLFRPNRDSYAATLTSLDERFSQKWERNAATPHDRMATLQAFHSRGIFTWVSLEPTLDCEASLAIVRETHPYVDLYKVGRANYLPMTKTTDWRDYTARMLDELHQVGAKHYIKKDLQPFLPAGYSNPLRIKQHH